MKKIVFGMILASLVTTANAATPKEIAAIVKDYSEAVACQINDVETDPNQYKVLLVKPGYDFDDKIAHDGMGATSLVYWSGDFGCNGGNGTVAPNFTLIEQRGFSSVLPVVVTDFKFPKIDLVNLESFNFKDDILIIKGVTYKPADRQHYPTKKVTYRFKYLDGNFVKI